MIRTMLYDRNVLITELINHWREGSRSCGCGWSSKTKRWSEHLADQYEKSYRKLQELEKTMSSEDDSDDLYDGSPVGDMAEHTVPYGGRVGGPSTPLPTTHTKEEK